METVVIHGTKDKVMEIMDIYKEYVPVFYNSKNYKWDMIKAIYSHPEHLCMIWEDLLGEMNVSYLELVDMQNI